MQRRTEGLRRWRIWMLISAACLGGTVAVVASQGSAAATSFKPFAVVICAAGQSCPPGSPPVVAPGSAAGITPPAAITALITNENLTGTTILVGSANLTAPAGVTIASASIGGTAIPNCTPATPKGTSCNTGSVLQLRTIDISPGGSVQVSMAIKTPPPPGCTTAAPCQWGATAKQANDYNGSGNGLNLDLNSSQLAIVTSSQASCTAANQANDCSTTLANGGTNGSTQGSISITTDATGTSSGTFYETIDYGPHLPASDCSGIDSMHDEYISGPALTGQSARSFTVTINTTDYPGYQAELCATTSMQFRAKVPQDPNEATEVETPDGDEGWTLGWAMPVTQPDGTPGYAGLLPDCTTNSNASPPTVDPNTYPCVLSRSTTGNVHTIVASFPAGFDATLRN